MASTSGSLRRYLLTRLALVVPMVFILLTMVFVLLRVAPGNPIVAALGGHLSPSQLAARERAAGYDKPLVVQYGEYLRQVFTGHFGTTLTDQRPVTQVIAQNGAATLELTVAAMLVALAVGIPLGMLAGRLRDTWVDAGARGFGIVIYAAPVFFLGLLAQLVFGTYLGWLPTSSQASVLVQATLQPHTNILLLDAMIDGQWGDIPNLLAHLVMPAVTLGLVISGVVVRLVRVNVIQAMKGDYIEAARAGRGRPPRLQERSGAHRHGDRAPSRALALRGRADRGDLQLAGHRQRAHLLPGEPGLHRSTGHHHGVRLGGGGHQPAHRFHQRLGGPKGQVLMTTGAVVQEQRDEPGLAAGPRALGPGRARGVRHLVAPLLSARGLPRWLLWTGLALTSLFVVLAVFAPLVSPYGFNQYMAHD